jgi:hypothetical protein
MTRSKIARLPRAPLSPNAMMMPETMNAAMNISSPPPMAATKPSADFASSPILGCRLFTSEGRSACALDHMACNFSPTSGHPATWSGGAGICNEFVCTL